MARSGHRDFHTTSFDNETLLKLQVFRMYVREWLPVFLSKRTHRYVNIFDFFAGPGCDATGHPGSPLIIVDEAKRYYGTREVDPQVNLALHFSDKDENSASQLRRRIGESGADPTWTVEVAALDFESAFANCLPHIRNRESANLLILDQFGFKHLTRQVFEAIASCHATDLICFISSSYVSRFADEPVIRRLFEAPSQEIRAVPRSDVHRWICKQYGNWVPASEEYDVAPFSIKSGSNIYGLIFGSGNLYGFEKFLRVSWQLDKFTGEANFAIDNDAIVVGNGQMSCFDEDNVPKKQKEFEARLKSFLLQSSRTNRDVYRFTIENGFLPKQVNAMLKNMEENRGVLVERIGTTSRRGYYISWEHYKEREPKAVFTYRGTNE